MSKIDNSQQEKPVDTKGTPAGPALKNKKRRDAIKAKRAGEKTDNVVSSTQNRINSEKKFRIYKTAELASDLSRGIERLRQQGDGETAGNLTEQEIEKVQQAITLALELHIDQKDRPSGEPYVNHILSVTRRVVVEYGSANPNVVMAAALHDSVEDQSPKIAALNTDAEGGEREKSLAYIASRFGERVSVIVAALSNEEVSDDLDTATKNRMYLEHVAEAVKDPEVALIKLADFSDNALTLEKVADPGKRLRLTEKYMPVVAMFIDRIQNDDIQMSGEQKNNLVAKLRSKYDEMRSYLENKTDDEAGAKVGDTVSAYDNLLLGIALTSNDSSEHRRERRKDLAERAVALLKQKPLESMGLDELLDAHEVATGVQTFTGELGRSQLSQTEDEAARFYGEIEHRMDKALGEEGQGKIVAGLHPRDRADLTMQGYGCFGESPKIFIFNPGSSVARVLQDAYQKSIRRGNDYELERVELFGLTPEERGDDEPA